MMTEEEFLQEVIKKRPLYYESDAAFMRALNIKNKQNFTKWKNVHKRVPHKWKPLVADLLHIDLTGKGSEIDKNCELDHTTLTKVFDFIHSEMPDFASYESESQARFVQLYYAAIKEGRDPF